MNQSKSGKALKAGIWYTISNFTAKGLVFLSTPIFTRILSKNDFGVYSNYATWRNLLIIIVTLELYSTVVRAKFDFGEKIDQYLSTIVLTGSFVTVLFYIVVLVNISFFSKLFSLPTMYIHILFIYMLSAPAIQILQAKNQIFMRYKTAALLTFLSTGISAIVAICFTFLCEDKLFGRIFGQESVLILVNFCIYVWIIYKGRCFKIEYAKYAIIFAVPLVPHLLAGNLLGSFDRIAIEKMSGAESLAVYSLAYNCALIVSVLLDSLNQAMVPWLYNNLAAKNYTQIKQITRYYVGIFIFIAVGVILMVPEIISIFGGLNYGDSKYVMAPLVMGTCFKVVYSLYVNIEMYEKKTMLISFGTLMAAGLNIPLNYFFIERFGYIAAAYTTMFCYGILMIFHCYSVNKLGYKLLYDNRFYFAILTLMLVLLFVIVCLYNCQFARWMAIVIYGIVVVIALYKCRSIVGGIIKLIKKRGNEM